MLWTTVIISPGLVKFFISPKLSYKSIKPTSPLTAEIKGKLPEGFYIPTDEVIGFNDTLTSKVNDFESHNIAFQYITNKSTESLIENYILFFQSNKWKTNVIGSTIDANKVSQSTVGYSRMLISVGRTKELETEVTVFYWWQDRVVK